MIEITFFDGGQNMAFEDGEQVPPAQKPWLLVFAEYLDDGGIDPTACRFVMPDGTERKVVRGEDGFNLVGVE